jgi:tRNA dimethylallyltransferase
VKGTFFIVGPTATGKSELAADVARMVDAEIVNADAFQIYRGLDLLSAKPDRTTRSLAPHHLISVMPLSAEMSAETFRRRALQAIRRIHARNKPAIVVGGSGLYIKALTHGLVSLPASDPTLRARLNTLSMDDLRAQLGNLDPEIAREIDMNNRRRLVRALEISMLTGKPASAHRKEWVVAKVGVSPIVSPEASDPCPPASTLPATGVFVFRDREELYERINRRVETMFEKGVIESVRAAGATGGTASQMIGLRQIHQLLEGKMSVFQCIAEIQQATRRYAKRQLTWFRGQSTFEPLNLSLFSHNEAVEWISLRAQPRTLSGHGDD